MTDVDVFVINNATAVDFYDIFKFFTKKSVKYFGEYYLKYTTPIQYFGRYVTHRIMARKTDEHGEIIAYAEFNTSPCIPALMEDCWMDWIKYHYCTALPLTLNNTCFFNTFVYNPKYASKVLRRFIAEIFYCENKVDYIITVKPPAYNANDAHLTSELPVYSYLEEFSHIYYPKCFSAISCPNTERLYVMFRKDRMPHMRYRLAIPEDNDEIVTIAHSDRPELIESLGEFYLAEELLANTSSYVIVTEIENTTAGFVWLKPDVAILQLLLNYQLDMFDSIIKFNPKLKFREKIMEISTLKSKPSDELFDTKAVIQIYKSSAKCNLSKIDDLSQRVRRDALIDIFLKRCQLLSSNLNDGRYYYKVQRMNHAFRYNVYDKDNRYDAFSNVFAIQLYGLDRHYDPRCILHFLNAAYTAYPDRNYCLLSIPYTMRMTPNLFEILKYFVRVDPRPGCKNDKILYITHRAAIFSDINLCPLEKNDIMALMDLTIGITPINTQQFRRSTKFTASLLASRVPLRTNVQDISDIYMSENDKARLKNDWEFIEIILNDSLNNPNSEFQCFVVKSGDSTKSEYQTTIIGFIIIKAFYGMKLLAKHFLMPKFGLNSKSIHAELITLRLHPFFHYQSDLIFRELSRQSHFKHFLYFKPNEIPYLHNDLMSSMQPVEPRRLKKLWFCDFAPTTRKQRRNACANIYADPYTNPSTESNINANTHRDTCQNSNFISEGNTDVSAGVTTNRNTIASLDISVDASVRINLYRGTYQSIYESTSAIMSQRHQLPDISFHERSIDYIDDYFSLFSHNVCPSMYFGTASNIVVIGFTNMSKAFLRVIIFGWYELSTALPLTLNNTCFFNTFVYNPKYASKVLRRFIAEIFYCENKVDYIITVKPPAYNANDAHLTSELPVYSYLEEFSHIYYPKCFSAISCPNTERLYVMFRKDRMPHMRYRLAIPEDNDEIVTIAHSDRPELIESLGEFYLAEELLANTSSYVIVTEIENTTAGFVWLKPDVAILQLLLNYQLDMFDSIIKFNPKLKFREKIMEISTLKSKPSDELFDTKAVIQIYKSSAKCNLSKIDDLSQRVRRDALFDIFLKRCQLLSSNLNDGRYYYKVQRMNHAFRYNVYDKDNRYDAFSNVFAIQLYGLDRHYDPRCILHFLNAAYTAYPDRNYCLLSIPYTMRMTPNLFEILKYFVRVDPRPGCKNDKILYITHRAAIFSDINLCPLEKNDIMALMDLTIGIAPINTQQFRRSTKFTASLLASRVPLRTNVQDISDIYMSENDKARLKNDWEFIEIILNDSLNNPNSEFQCFVVKSGDSTKSEYQTTIIGFIIIKAFYGMKLLAKHFLMPKFGLNSKSIHAELITLRLHPFFHCQSDLIFRELSRQSHFKHFLYFKPNEIPYLHNDLMSSMQPVEPRRLKKLWFCDFAPTTRKQRRNACANIYADPYTNPSTESNINANTHRDTCQNSNFISEGNTDVSAGVTTNRNTIASLDISVDASVRINLYRGTYQSIYESTSAIMSQRHQLPDISFHERSIDYIDDYFSLFSHNVCPSMYFGTASNIVVIGFTNMSKAFLRVIIFGWYELSNNFTSNNFLPRINITVICEPGIIEAEYSKKFNCDFCSNNNNCWLNYTNSNAFIRDVTDRLDLRIWIRFVSGHIDSIIPSKKIIQITSGCVIYYEYLLLMCETEYGMPTVIEELNQIPSNYMEINCRLHKIILYHKLLASEELRMKFKRSIIVYGQHIRAFEFIDFLLKHGVAADEIVMISPYSLENSQLQLIYNCPDQDEAIEEILHEMIRDSGIKLYTNTNVTSVTCHKETGDLKTVTFQTHDDESITIHCDLFVSFEEKYITKKFIDVLERAGIDVQDKYILVDEVYKTSADYVYALGKFTKHLEDPNHQYTYVNCSEAATKFIYYMKWNNVSMEMEEKYVQPEYFQAHLPMNYYFVKVTLPKRYLGRHLTNDYGVSMTTYKDYEFSRIRLDINDVIEEILVVTQKTIDFDFLQYIVGRHEKLLNNMKYRWYMKEITNFVEYFQQPFMELIMNDHFPSLQDFNKNLTKPFAEMMMRVQVSQNRRRSMADSYAHDVGIISHMQEALLLFLQIHRDEFDTGFALPGDFQNNEDHGERSNVQYEEE